MFRFKVLRRDGRNLVTDRGCVSVSPFSYADGGKTHPLSADDAAQLTNHVVALPYLVAALERLLDESPFVSDVDSCECGDWCDRHDCEHVQGRVALAMARGEAFPCRE